MKNFFTSVRLPEIVRGRVDAECALSIRELVSQLRATLCSLDEDNLSDKFRKKLMAKPTAHIVDNVEALKNVSAEKGDLVLVVTKSNIENMWALENLYVYRGEEKV